MPLRNAFFKILSPPAVLPERKSTSAAGFDLCSSEETLIQPGEVKKIKTGLALALEDENFCAFIYPRSSTIIKHNLLVVTGIIDADYRGELQIVVKNLNDVQVCLPAQVAIAQLLFQKVEAPTVVSVPALSSTERGGRGFGSTDLPASPDQGHTTWRSWDPKHCF
jgi:dUTP pyrophosphatase